jgi:hypothetical protein
VEPVPDPLLLRKTGSTGNRTRACGSVAKEVNTFLVQQLNCRLLCVVLGSIRVCY